MDYSYCIFPNITEVFTRVLLGGLKSNFWMKVNLAFYLEIKVTESGGKFPVGYDLSSHAIHWC